MNSENCIEIAAPAPVVWDIYTDVESWPSWTASVERIVALDGGGIEIGRRFEIKQPRMPTLVWEVTDVVPGVSWSWRQRSFGATTLASHELVTQEGDRTLVRQSIDQRGPLGVVVGVLMARLTKRYLDLESNGLKEVSEQRWQAESTSA
jgi:uncharacterized membrane protein